MASKIERFCANNSTLKRHPQQVSQTLKNLLRIQMDRTEELEVAAKAAAEAAAAVAVWCNIVSPR